MSTALEEPPMPKKNAGGKEPPTIAVKIDRALATKARLIAADKGEDLGAFVSEALRGVVDREWIKMIRRAGEKGEKP